MSVRSDGGAAQPGPVLVTGATGDVGGQVAQQLVAMGVTVRAMYRRDSQRGQLEQIGAVPVMAGFGDDESLRAAMQEVSAMFLLTPPVPGQADLDKQVIDLAVAERVPRVVRLSAADSNLRASVPWARAHAVADHHLAGTDLDWTVLRPSAFMQNFRAQAATIKRGLLPHTSGRGKISWLDTADLAAVAARVLRDGGHSRATYFLTGPEPLSVPEVADYFSRALGRRVRYLHLPGPVYALAIRASGQSWFTARGLQHQFVDVVRANVDVDTTSEVQRLLGRPATTFHQWLQRSVEAFQR